MTTVYTLRVTDATGRALASYANFTEQQGVTLDYVLSVGRIGTISVGLPSTVDLNNFPLDARIGIWRSINGAAPRLDGDSVFLIRKYTLPTDGTVVLGLHANHLLARRQILYGTWQAQAVKAAAPADDQIKAFVDENMLAGSTTGSRYGGAADISAYLSKQANLGLAASIPKSAAWMPLYDTVQELCEASTQAGTYLTAEIVAPTPSTLELRTYVGQRGTDHRASSNAPVIFSESRGNLTKAVLDLDFTQEITYALAGGAGSGIARQTGVGYDASRIIASPLNRIEAFVEASNITDTTDLNNQALAAVQSNRPSRVLTGELIETPNCIRGIHFDYGDIVTVEHRGLAIDMRFDTVHETLSATSRKSEILFRSVL